MTRLPILRSLLSTCLLALCAGCIVEAEETDGVVEGDEDVVEVIELELDDRPATDHVEGHAMSDAEEGYGLDQIALPHPEDGFERDMEPDPEPWKPDDHRKED